MYNSIVWINSLMKTLFRLFLAANCKTDPRGKTFQGSISTTKGGRTCEQWSRFVLPAFITDFPDRSWEEVGNKCRNPNDYIGPWCFISGNFATCDVPHCSMLFLILQIIPITSWSPDIRIHNCSDRLIKNMHHNQYLWRAECWQY